jgi:RecJ-like exonuclease
MNDVITRGYEHGTFQLGKKVYHIREQVHRFTFHKTCECCDSTGKVLIKGKEFKCPNCNGAYESKEVIEMVLDDFIECKIGGIITFTNKKGVFEIYTTSDNGTGWIIQRQSDGDNRWFKTKEEAQSACDRYNSQHGVYALLNEYQLRKAREG